MFRYQATQTSLTLQGRLLETVSGAGSVIHVEASRECGFDTQEQ
jgi:hypothetical protein